MNMSNHPTPAADARTILRLDKIRMRFGEREVLKGIGSLGPAG